jgi:hypothetical protein
MKYRLNSAITLGAINHMRFLFDLICEGGQLSGHFFLLSAEVRRFLISYIVQVFLKKPILLSLRPSEI